MCIRDRPMGRCYGNQLILDHFGNVKIDHLHSLLWRSETECTNAFYRPYAWFDSTATVTISCKILAKIGPVVSAVNKITDGNCVACSRRVRRILSNISGCTGPIFAIFSPNESVLGADDRSRPTFSISQGTLPWQPTLWKNGKLCSFVVAFRNGMG